MTVSARPETDPRARTDGLGWVTRAVFPDERAVLTLGAPPAGHRVVARYAVVPSVARARFLLPLGAPRAMAAALLSYNALRPPKVRAARAALGMLARVGGVERLPFPTLSVALPDGVASADALITAQLADALGGGAPAYAACGVRPPDPNHKPTLQLFAADGRPLGYAKLGWNDATRALVAAEADALRALPALAGAPDYPLAPRLLTELTVADRRVAVVEPLPAAVRGQSLDRPPPFDALLAVARRGGPPAPPRPLAGSPFLARLAAEAARAAAGEPAGVRAVVAVDALARRHASTEVEFGHWHGDWVPWNLGWHAGRLVAWDWEHSGPDVPVGFDLAHDAFQRAVVLAGAPVAVAGRAVDDQLARHGARLGLGPAQRRLVADAYLLEMWLRTWRLAAAGAGWNAALHPGLLDLVEERYRHPEAP